MRLNIRQEFHEATAAARRRGVLLPDDFYGRIPIAARSRAFTVSGLASVEQIGQVLDDMREVLSDGKTFAQWRKAALERPELAALPKGRLETIYRNAVQTAYNAGHWEQAQAAKARRPYLMYDAIDDNRTRPSHQALDGFIAPIDDPCWQSIMPPNGHNCRCSAITLTQAQAEARGWTGATPPLPAQPDNGWAHNPAGKEGDAELRLMLQRRQEQMALPRPAEWLGAQSTLEEARQAGAQILDEILRTLAQQDAGAPIPPEAAKEVRAALQKALQETRPCGGNIVTLQKSGKAVESLKKVAELLPADWIAAANAVSLDAKYSKKRGFYSPVDVQYKKGKIVRAAVWSSDESSTALHEYIHHIQAMLPEIDRFFQQEHQRRTDGDPIEQIYSWTKKEVGRPDDYVNRYFGKEYEQGGALEVMTMSYEALLGGAMHNGANRADDCLVEMIEKDRALLDLATGLLFKYKP